MIYTKEPWEIRNGSTGPYIIAKDGNGNHVTVAQVFPRGVAGCETKGNAGLVKAAPKMYGALRKAKETIKAWYNIGGAKDWDVYDCLSPEMKVINEALAEVEGKEGEDGQS